MNNNPKPIHIGYTAIIIAGANILMILNRWLFSKYALDIGIEGEIGKFLLYNLLLLGGIKWLNNKKSWNVFFGIFALGIIIERTTIFIIYRETLYFLPQLIHIIIGIIFLLITLNGKYYPLEEESESTVE